MTDSDEPRQVGRPQKYDSGRVEPITFYLPPDLKLQLLQASGSTRKNRSEWLAEVLTEHFARPI